MVYYVLTVHIHFYGPCQALFINICNINNVNKSQQFTLASDFFLTTALGGPMR